ncbi:MAG: sensor domain-containing diguanylate cyclase [Nitrospirae bacterium]|nr:sensor domain-containing diguanylate cyclase [Nitrospirota bacterium]
MKLKQRLNLISFFITAALFTAICASYQLITAASENSGPALYLLIILSVTALTTALITLRLLIRRLVNPVDELTHSVRSIAGGHNSPINISGTNELQSIVADINTIVSVHRGKISSLENAIEEKQKSMREMAILNELMGFTTSETKFEIIMKNLVDRTKDLVKSEYCAAIIFEPGSYLTRFFVTSRDSQNPPAVSLSPEGFFKKLLRNQSPLRVPSGHSNTVSKTADSVCCSQQCLNLTELNLEVRDLLAVPLIFSSELLGLLLTANKIDGTFEQDDEDKLMNFAFQAFQIIAMHDKIANLAITDGLTGLNNHRHFQERLMEEVEMSRRYGRSLSLLILDIDHFKAFNDAHGHQAGDTALKMIASLIEEQVRRTDFAARYGGEEFSIIMPETVYSGAKIFAERLRKKIAGTPFPCSDGEKALITVSIGFSSIPENTKDKNELIEMADRALYYAKEHGRNASYGFADTRSKHTKLKH